MKKIWDNGRNTDEHTRNIDENRRAFGGPYRPLGSFGSQQPRFLSEEEILKIKEYVPHALAEVPHLLVAEDESQSPLGFMGIDGQRLEMLFLSPDAIGKGLGKALIEQGFEKYGVCEVTVNEQNPKAKGFYEHMGFAAYRRTDCDEQGAPYPLLYMKRTT